MKKINIIIIGIAITLIFSSCNSTNDSKESTAAFTVASSGIQQLDDSMPEPFNVETNTDTGGDQLRIYYDPYVIKYGDFPGSLLDLVDQDELTDWVNEFEDGIRNRDEENIHTFLKEFNIDEKTAIEWFDKKNNSTSFNDPNDLTKEDIEILYSDNEELIKENFVSEYSILSNGEIYTPEWIYTHTKEAYEQEEIPAYLIKEKMSLYKDIPFTSKALTALENKIDSYSRLGLTFEKASTETSVTSETEVTTVTKQETSSTSDVNTSESSNDDTLSNSQSKDVVAGTSTKNPTAEEILSENPTADLFIMNGIVYVNAADTDWVTELELSIEGNPLGEIKQTQVTSIWQDFDATILEVGTKIYAFPNRSDLVIAVQGENLIPYIEMIEG